MEEDGGWLENKDQPLLQSAPPHRRPTSILTPHSLYLSQHSSTSSSPQKNLTTPPPPPSAVSMSLPVPGTRSEPCSPFINLSPDSSSCLSADSCVMGWKNGNSLCYPSLHLILAFLQVPLFSDFDLPLLQLSDQ